MACRLFGAKPIPEPMLAFCHIKLLGTNFSEIWIGILSFSFKKMRLKMSCARMTAILSRGRWVNAGLNKMADISQSAFEMYCTKSKLCVFWFKYYHTLFLGVNWQEIIKDLCHGLVSKGRQVFTFLFSKLEDSYCWLKCILILSLNVLN